MTVKERSTPTHAFSNDVLADHDATALAELIRKREISVPEVTEAAIARAEAVNPLLQGIATPDFDSARAWKPCSGFFAGVPTLIKDNTDVAGLPTGHGSAAVRATNAKRDGAFVRQYRSLGLNNLGKSALPEFGFNASTEPVHREATLNPWNPLYSSGASSGGSAAMVAAGVVPIAHANDGGGSIRIPAACCGLVGLKPSRGRLVDGEAARSLPINIISEGVVTRSVRDTANFFTEMEKYYRNSRLPEIGEVRHAGKRRLRIGLVTESVTDHATDSKTIATVEHTAALLEKLGHTITPIEIPVDQRFPDDFAHYWALLAFTMCKAGKYVTGPGFDASQVDGLTAGLDRNFRRAFHRTPSVLWHLRKTRIDYARATEKMGLDVVLSPALAHTTPRIGYLDPSQRFDELFERLRRYVSFTPLANVTGAPAIVLPMGITSENLPVAVHFSGVTGDERTLLELAFELEEAAPWRRIDG